MRACFQRGVFRFSLVGSLLHHSYSVDVNFVAVERRHFAEESTIPVLFSNLQG